MPTLLKNSAAEGYRMGSASHLAELDRNEAARQADLNRYERARANTVKTMIDMYTGEGSDRLNNMTAIDKNGNPANIREIIRDSSRENEKTFAPADWVGVNPDKTFYQKEYRNVNKRQDQHGGVNMRGGK